MFSAEEVSRFVENNREEAIRCLQEILQTPSVTGDEEPVSFVFEKWMKNNGMEVQRIEAQPHRPNLITDWVGSKNGKKFLFNGHMDVFPPNQRDPGKFGPWSGKEYEGHVYGRGAADMKGGDAAALMAVIFLRRMGFIPKGTVSLSWMCDEENGGELGVQYLLNNGYLDADFGICMEPSNGKICAALNGILRGYVTYKSEAGHTAVLYKGKTALQKALKAIGKLEELNEELIHRDHPKGTVPPHLTVAVLNSGEVANVYPSKAVFWFDRRLVPGETHEVALKEITNALENLKKEDTSFDYELTVTSRRPMLDIPFDDPFIQLCAASYKKIYGKEPQITGGPWGCDASWIRKVNGVVMPYWGIGDGDNEMSQPNEKINTQGYLDFIKVYMMCVIDAMS